MTNVESDFSVMISSQYVGNLERQIKELEPYKVELLKIAEQLGEGLDPFAAWEVLDHMLRTLKSTQREKEIFSSAYYTVYDALETLGETLEGDNAQYCKNISESLAQSILYEVGNLDKERPKVHAPLFPVNSWVEKYIGEARYFGQVRAIYTTNKGGIRYVVEVLPQGFQMVAVANQLRSVAKEDLPDYINVNKLAIDDALHHIEPEIFSRDEKIAHMAASPMTVEHKRHGVRENIMRYIRFWKNGE